MQRVLSTNGDVTALHELFAELGAADLCACLIAAHRLSFIIFQEAWLVRRLAGMARGAGGGGTCGGATRT